MENQVQILLQKMCNKDEAEAYLYADKLAQIGTDEVIESLIGILKGEDIEDAYLAARALSKIKNNQAALPVLMEIIHDNRNKNRNGLFVQMLEGFDLSDSFVDLFRIYLFGNFKSAALAKEYLDTVEFDISPRVLKKMEKHWNHFKNNTAPDSEDFQIKNSEVMDMIQEIKSILSLGD